MLALFLLFIDLIVANSSNLHLDYFYLREKKNTYVLVTLIWKKNHNFFLSFLKTGFENYPFKILLFRICSMTSETMNYKVKLEYFCVYLLNKMSSFL